MKSVALFVLTFFALEILSAKDISKASAVVKKISIENKASKENSKSDTAAKLDAQSLDVKKMEASAVPATTESSNENKNVESESLSEKELKEAEAWVQQADQKNSDALNVENKKESEIPVLSAAPTLNATKKSSSTARVVLSLALIVALFGAFAFYAKKNFLKAPKNKNTQIKVLTQHYLGPKKSLAIVRVAGESVLIGVTDHNINLIKTLALMDEEIPQEIPNDFQSSFSKFFSKNESQEVSDSNEKDEFSISKIKDVVSGKLKNMREI